MYILIVGSHTGIRSGNYPIYRRLSPAKVSSLFPSYLRRIADRNSPLPRRQRPPFVYSSPNKVLLKNGPKGPVISKKFLNRGCPVLNCPVMRVPSRCKVSVFFRYNGRLCRGCYKNVCRRQY